MKTLSSCDLCGNTSFKFLFSGSDRIHHVKGKYSVFRCKKCWLAFLNPQPSMKELEPHYGSDYYSMGEAKPSAIAKLIFDTYYLKNGNPLLKLLFLPFKPLMIRTVPFVQGGKLLDVGCGAGNFLAQIKSRGMKLCGVEPGKFDKKFIKKHGLNIFQGTLEQAKYPKNYFDIITMNQVFEHLNNQKETLRELRRILKPGGTLVIAVPQRRCLNYLIFGKYWQHIDIPRHLIVPSIKNMKSYVKEAGFKIKKIKYVESPSSFLASLLYWTNNFRKHPIYAANTNFMNNPLLFVLLMPYALLCNFLRIGDKAEVIVVK